MIKLPVKDPVTIPRMSQREIPVIKAVLSEWRAKRKDRPFARQARDTVALIADCDRHSQVCANTAAWLCEKLAAIDERMREEARKCK